MEGRGGICEEFSSLTAIFLLRFWSKDISWPSVSFVYEYASLQDPYLLQISHFRRIHTLIGHRGEISNAQFNFDCSLIVSGSMVKQCLWFFLCFGE